MRLNLETIQHTLNEGALFRGMETVWYEKVESDLPVSFLSYTRQGIK